MLDRIAAALVGRWRSLVIAILGVLLSGAVLGMAGSEGSTATGATDALPVGAASTEVARLQEQLPQSQTTSALVVFSRSDGAPLTPDEIGQLTTVAQGLQAEYADPPLPPGAPALIPSENLLVAISTIPLPDTGSVVDTADTIDAIRTSLSSSLPAGVLGQVTGPAGILADIANIFDGANITLLGVTALVVAILLLITYRSPFLWLVPLIVVGLADRIAVVAAVKASELTGIPIDESGTGILSVLVFGAGTNYALLLISRYRDELRRNEVRVDAMRQALARSIEPIVAAGSTVVLALLTLLLSLFPTTRGLGLACAIGVIVAMAYGLVLLPSALVVFGRGLFWPFVPKVGQVLSGERSGLWSRIGRLVGRRPGAVLVAGSMVIIVSALGLTQAQLGLATNDQFRETPEAVAALDTLAKGFPAGSSDPVIVMTTPGELQAVTTAAASVPGVASTRPGPASSSLAQLDVVLDSVPGTTAAYDQVRALRAALAPFPETYVGGSTAREIDRDEATARDLRIIVPLILVLVFLVLIVLLRALVAPVLLVVTVVATFFASMGLSWWVSSKVLGFPAYEGNVPLFAFLFLVALGVDYNIFLVTRAREDGRMHGTRDGMIRALASTGGVITSAGILLAAVFAVLGVLPLVVLTQLGIIVCIGVLLDTLLVRTVIVPSLAMLLGERFWLPGRIVADGDRAREPVSA